MQSMPSSIIKEYSPGTHPTPEVLQEIAHKAFTTEEVQKGFPALWAHLQECEECLAAFTELLKVAHEEGHREKEAEASEIRRTVMLTAIAGVVAVVLLASGLLLEWQRRTEGSIVNRVYTSMSPAVANIQISSAGVTGSGVVYDKSGYLVTNYHVVREAKDNADIVVQLPGLGQVPAELVGYDIATDLAVLKVDAPPDRLTVAQFDNAGDVKVGDLAIAIGNPFGLSHTLTVGRISALERRLMSDDMYAPDVEGVIQTDAAINPGNSGGPLFNARGLVIGITTRIESPSGGSVGLGFAIPSTTVIEVAQEIIERGYVRRPFLGVGGQPLNSTLARDLNLPVDKGLLVQEIHPGSPAEKVGLRTGQQAVRTSYGEVMADADIILAMDGRPILNQSDLNHQVATHEVGDKAVLEILRAGQKMTLEVVLGERPHGKADPDEPASRGQPVGG